MAGSCRHNGDAVPVGTAAAAAGAVPASALEGNLSAAARTPGDTLPQLVTGVL